jgi:hypothetical protein
MRYRITVMSEMGKSAETPLGINIMEAPMTNRRMNKIRVSLL